MSSPSSPPFVGQYFERRLIDWSTRARYPDLTGKMDEFRAHLLQGAREIPELKVWQLQGIVSYSLLRFTDGWYIFSEMYFTAHEQLRFNQSESMINPLDRK